MAQSEGQTLLKVLCSHCAGSPRAPRSVVELSGGPGFPLTLRGRSTTHNKISDPVLPNGTFLQNPGLEPSDLAISCLQTVPKAKMEELANLGASSLIRGSLFRDTSL